MAEKKTPIVGPWEVQFGRTYSGVSHYKLTRRNSAWLGGLETLLTPKACNIKRFRDRTKADAEAARLNAAAGVPPTRTRKATDAEVLEWAKRHDLDCWDNLMAARQAFEDAETHHLTRASGVGVHPDTAANNSPLAPNGLMFDALGKPRSRYVRISFDGSCLVCKPDDAAQNVGDDDRSEYVLTDVYLSDREFADLPEFNGW